MVLLPLLQILPFRLLIRVKQELIMLLSHLIRALVHLVPTIFRLHLTLRP